MTKHIAFTTTSIALTLALAAPAQAQMGSTQEMAQTAVDAVSEATNAVPAPMTAEDLVSAPRLGGATTTPDGRFAVYPVTTTDRADYSRGTTHYLLDLSQADAQPLALALGEGAHSAQFGSDSWLYFLKSSVVKATMPALRFTAWRWRLTAISLARCQ